MLRDMTRSTLALMIVAALGCSHDKPKTVKTTPDPIGPTTGTAQPAKPAPVVTGDQQVSPGLAISGDIAAACGIKAAANPAPNFDYDKEELSPEDKAILDQIATCLMTGALKGKQIALIGRADPRGTEEYNLGLGSRRSQSVSTYLARLGVGAPQLAVTTRGALDATGTDETGYAKDRRVDLQLAKN
jgi:peptidoglycan-associated lipoprotein